jgi:hypothetical protein
MLKAVIIPSIKVFFRHQTGNVNELSINMKPSQDELTLNNYCGKHFYCYSKTAQNEDNSWNIIINTVWMNVLLPVLPAGFRESKMMEVKLKDRIIKASFNTDEERTRITFTKIGWLLELQESFQYRDFLILFVAIVTVLQNQTVLAGVNCGD